QLIFNHGFLPACIVNRLLCFPKQGARVVIPSQRLSVVNKPHYGQRSQYTNPNVVPRAESESREVPLSAALPKTSPIKLRSFHGISSSRRAAHDRMLESKEHATKAKGSNCPIRPSTVCPSDHSLAKLP